jgi:hypothetical protein
MEILLHKNQGNEQYVLGEVDVEFPEPLNCVTQLNIPR